VLRNEGADVAAHDMIRRQHYEAEGMERLSAEYLTLATSRPGVGRQVAGSNMPTTSSPELFQEPKESRTRTWRRR
jgi:hypothetical protein